MAQQKLVDRERLYRSLYEYTDEYGVLTKRQKELAPLVGMGYQRLCRVFQEFCWTGRMVKRGWEFQMFDPDSFEWGDSYSEERAQVLGLRTGAG
jgi:hypothetical protein